MTAPQRIAIAERRIINILSAQTIATLRTLEQKISDAGPNPQRVEPFLLTKALRNLENQRRVIRYFPPSITTPWFHLETTSNKWIDFRLASLLPIYRAISAGSFVVRLGQTLEIAVYRALRKQSLQFFGHFRDLDEHDDATSYKKVEPPSAISGVATPGDKLLDFLLLSTDAGMAGIEVKNIREWLYPDRSEIRDLLLKCCHLNAVPVLIGRRIPYVTFSVLNRCGCIIHQNYNQLYPSSDAALAEKARDKDLLGYHDIRVGNEPDKRLLHFFENNLPGLLVDARTAFDKNKDLLREYADGSLSYKHFTKELPEGPPVEIEEEGP